MSNKDNRPTKVPVFAISNDTDKYIVILDGYYQAFDNKEQVQAVHNLAFRVPADADSLPIWKDKSGLPICETPFGDFELLKPNAVCKHRNFETGELIEMTDKISDYKPIDLIGYINKRWFCWDNGIIRQRQIQDPLLVPVLERLDIHRRNIKITKMLTGLGVNRNFHQRKPLPY